MISTWRVQQAATAIRAGAVIAYPTRSVAVILVVALAGVLFFREKLSRSQWIAVATIMAALVLLNI